MRKGWFAPLILVLLLLAACTSEEDAQSVASNSPVRTGQLTVVLNTTMGDISLALDSQKAPKTVENFLLYARKGAYDGTIFHRVIDGFMIQGGGLDQNLVERPALHAVENESNNGLDNRRGTIAMARTQEPNSATRQFFINTADNHFLDYGAQGTSDWGYTVFGRVIDGMTAVDQIQKVPTKRAGLHQDVPVHPIIINSVQVKEP